MAELLVTAEDLREPVCGECLHLESVHIPEQAPDGSGMNPWGCRRTRVEVRRSHWDAVVRREVVKALRGVDTAAMARAWGGAASWFTSGAKVAAVVGDWLSQDADEVESGAGS